MPICRLTARSAEESKAVSSCPLMQTCPLLALSSRLIQRISELLPAPL